MDCLKLSNWNSDFEGCCVESQKDAEDAIAFKDLTVGDVAKLSVEKFKGKLKFVNKWNGDWKKKAKEYLPENLNKKH